MDPSRNNMPLQFNRQKNQPPMPVTRTSDGLAKEDDVSSSTTMALMGGGEGSHSVSGNLGGQTVSVGASDVSGGDHANMLGVFSMLGQMVGPMATGMAATDPNMMMMGQMNFNTEFGGMMGAGPMGGPNMMGMQGMMGPSGPAGPLMVPQMTVKEVIQLKSSILYPPAPGAPSRSTRERPMGCKTIFIGGIPEKCTEDILFEVFESCGPIQSIRISKKNFAHIRFEMMESVDRALYISGYRMKINDSDEKEDTGRLHVDYAQARDDQHEFECQQRALAREMRHIQRLEQERLRPPSPPPVTYYSDHEASMLLESLKSDEGFTKSSQVLMTWLERGECNRRTSSTFYTLVQTAQGHVRRLKAEKAGVVGEYQQYKTQYQLRLQGITSQLCQVERVMVAAHKQKCWDHFTKAQRKNIDTWQRQAQEAREQEEDEEAGSGQRSGVAEDMDLSDDDEAAAGPSSKKRRAGSHTDAETLETQRLKEENDALKCQMEAFKNEVDTVRQEGSVKAEDKDKQIKALQNALQGMQQQLIAQRAIVTKMEKDLEEARKKSNSNLDTPLEEPETERTREVAAPAESKREESSTLVSSSGLALSDKEARILGLVCCFLHVHPHGATVDYLWSYLRQLMTVRVREVEDLLEKVPAIFQQEVIGVGAGTERRWIFTGMRTVSRPDGT
ncbi:hypothetical protein EGW08_009223 [Elysia chlorotica]|uniref:RRM domain-containing protein n=1 Tax=Elysia chlorotica TaxID=188477 RepID=A0A3S1BKQ9_ELYCH|nr:hypothetical protein EGW08_009223 [Elysia chlorotica]